MEVEKLKAICSEAKEEIKIASKQSLDIGRVEFLEKYQETIKRYQQALLNLATETGEEVVIDYELGCDPSPSGAGETIIQTENSVIIIFLAVTSNINSEGYCDDLGLGVVKCKNCIITKFGYPNDEGINEHPLYSKGLEYCSGVSEVINSSWKQEIINQIEQSGHRIWRNRYNEVYNLTKEGKREWHERHFIFLFKEKTFECIAESLEVKITNKSYIDVLNAIYSEIIVK